MIGRISFCNIRTNVARRPDKTHRLRDLEFWTAYYDLMAIERRQKARDIINSPDFDIPDWQRIQFSEWYRLADARSKSRHIRVRSQAKQIEEARGDHAPDAGYDRAKAHAERKMNELYTALRAAA